MTYLSRTAKLGIAAESADPVYTAPTFTVVFEQGTRFRDHIVQLKDSTLRGTDTDLQDIQQGPYWTDWTIQTLGYADWAGWLMRAMIGPDQCTPGVVTTFAAGSAAGATAVSLDAAPPSGSVLMLGTGASLEYAVCRTPSGSGPYTVPITNPASGLRFAHAAGDPAQSQASHLFQQDRTFATVWPSYSLTSDDGTESLGWPGCVLGSVKMTVKDNGWLGYASTWSGFPPASEATFTESGSAVQPAGGWAWQITTAGGPSTRGNQLDLTLSRPLDIVTACTGFQGPYVIGPGPMRCTASYKAVFDTAADLDLYRQAIQEPAVWTVAQPPLQGGSSIALTMSRSGWLDGEADLSGTYVSAAFKLAGITNSTDAASGGVAQATLVNFVQSAYGP